MDEPQKLMLTRSLDRSRKHSVDDVWQTAANAVVGMDQVAFVELLNGLWLGMGRNKEPDAATRKVWYYCLHDLTEQQMATGVRRYLTERSSEFVNVQLIRELSGIQSTTAAASLEGWTLAVEAIRIVGGYARPSFSDPLVSQTIASLGGWVEFCDTEPETLRNFTRARFLKTYEALASDGRKKYPARLVSLIDASGNPSETISLGMVEGSVRRLSNSGLVKTQ